MKTCIHISYEATPPRSDLWTVEMDNWDQVRRAIDYALSQVADSSPPVKEMVIKFETP